MLAEESTLGERIESARLARGLSNSQLARRIGVKPHTLQNWERDKTEPRSNKLIALSGILGVPPMWLLEGGAAPVEAVSHTHVHETADLESKLARLQKMHERMTQLTFEIVSEVNRLKNTLEQERQEAM